MNDDESDHLFDGIVAGVIGGLIFWSAVYLLCVWWQA